MKTNLSSRSGLAVLHGLTDADIDWMLDAGLEQELAPGALLVAENTRPDAIFLVASGMLSVFLGSDGDGRVAALGPGQIVGEMSFLEDRPSSASVAALEFSRVICLPTALLRTKLADDPGLAARLYRSIGRLTSQRLRELLGVVGRWTQEAPPAALAASEDSQEVAAETQAFKQKLIAAEHAPDPQAAAGDLSAALAEFAALLHRVIGPDAPAALDLRDELGARVQQELLPFFLKSPVAERLYHKPRGYALDFQTMELIAENDTAGETALDAALRRLPSLAALRNRERLLGDMIVHFAQGWTDAPFRFTTIADRAGRTAFSALSRATEPGEMQVTVYDFDTKALDQVAQRSAVAGRAAQFTCIDTHLLALVAGRLQTGRRDQHLVCSAGLADMLEDRFLLRVINSAYELLTPGGRLLLGFYHAGQPDRSFLSCVLNVNLIHRTEGEVNELLAASHFGRPATMVRFEPEHACFLAECVKPGPPLGFRAFGLRPPQRRV